MEWDSQLHSCRLKQGNLEYMKSRWHKRFPLWHPGNLWIIVLAAPNFDFRQDNNHLFSCSASVSLSLNLFFSVYFFSFLISSCLINLQWYQNNCYCFFLSSHFLSFLLSFFLASLFAFLLACSSHSSVPTGIYIFFSRPQLIIRITISIKMNSSSMSNKSASCLVALCCCSPLPSRIQRDNPVSERGPRQPLWSGGAFDLTNWQAPLRLPTAYLPGIQQNTAACRALATLQQYGGPSWRTGPRTSSPCRDTTAERWHSREAIITGPRFDVCRRGQVEFTMFGKSSWWSKLPPCLRASS